MCGGECFFCVDTIEVFCILTHALCMCMWLCVWGVWIVLVGFGVWCLVAMETQVAMLCVNSFA